MRQTEKFGLNLPDLTDPMSLAPLNENTEKIAALLGANVWLCSGTYEGDGSAEKRIETPGLTPVAVLMNSQKTAGGEYNTSVELSVPGGWVLWVGEDLPAYCGKLEPGHNGTDFTESYHHWYNTALKFTAEKGALSWALEDPGDIPAAAVNNLSGTAYQWIAFGVSE